MAQDRRINAAELDFDTLKSNLITYMKEQPGAFQDYNFEGSAMSTMIDVLSYITHINAVNANFALNETFLDTAQLRESVVSHAKLLSYTPRSATPSRAVVDIELLAPYVPSGSLAIDRGTKFTTIIDSVTYNLIASETSDAIVADINGKFIFNDVKLEQGTTVTRQYIYDDSGFEKYVLNNPNVNTESLIVEVYESATSTDAVSYAKSVNITNINGQSAVYFLEESRTGYYEIRFGDGIIGKKPSPGNIIKLSYTSLDEVDINGATVFSLAGSIGGNTDANVSTVSLAVGGAPLESSESVKFNAPLGFVAQNRAVTPDDYKAIIQNSYGNIESLTVWGGEDNIPPDYGKVYISIKPLDGESLSKEDKETIITKYLKPKNVVSITPILVDAKYTYIDLEIFFKFNPNVANVTSSKLAEGIRDVLTKYNNTNLKIFGGVFRFSNLLKEIDASNIAIISNITRITMHKIFTPSLGEDKYYKFDFNQSITEKIGQTNIIKSTLFMYRDSLASLQDYYDTEENKHIVQIISDTGKILNANVGVIDKHAGIVELNGFAPQSIPGIDIDFIKIMTKPASSDISPTRNELLSIDVTNAIITGEVDTMVTGGTSAGIDYNTVNN